MNANESKILNAVLKYGQSSTSFLTAYPGLTLFEYLKDMDRVLIAYVNTPGTWVGASDPLGNPDLHLPALLAFFAEAKKQKKTALLLPVSESLARLARARGCTTFQIGQEPWFKLQNFQVPKIAKNLKSRGSRVESFHPAQISAKERLGLEAITKDWLDSRKAAPLDFLNQVRPWIHMNHKRYFRVMMDGRPLAYLAAIPIPEKKAWYFIDLIRAKKAPLGTTELLISAAVEILKNQGAEFMTLGMAPLAPVQEGERTFHPKLYRLFDFGFEKMSFLYNFKSLYRFKEKLKPDQWKPLYLVTSEPCFGWSSGLGLFRAVFPMGFAKTIFITSTKIIRNGFRIRNLDRILSDQIVMRSKPSNAFDLVKRMKVTLTLFVVNVLFFIASTSGDLTLRPQASERFNFNIARYTDSGINGDDIRALLLHSFFHWNLFHLVFNMTCLLLFVGYLELIAGSGIILMSYALGILFSNPLTSVLIEPVLNLLSPNLSLKFVHEFDVGCSLGVFAGMGAVTCFVRHQKTILLGLTLGTLIVSYAESSILGLNHLIALAIGYTLGNYYVGKTEK